MLACDDKPTPLWRTLALSLAPIVVAEVCLAAREWIRREHKARLRRDRPPTTDDRG